MHCSFPHRRPTLHTDASGTAPPDAFGPFRVLHQIGAGTLGPIFRAYQPDPGRLVAVKQFRLGFSPESAARFVAALERIVAADLTHTGIAAPIAAGAIDATPYLALDFVAADSLDVVIREHGPLPIGDVLRFTRQLGRALDVAAGAGVLHGALHSRDLLMTADDVRMTGLGIAAALEEVGMTAPIRRPYSAPERCAHAAWDRRADVFSLAALTYEMLFGRPVIGVGPDAADGITTIDGADSQALHALFSKALAGDPTGRIATASAFVADLRAILPSAERHPSSSKRRKSESVRSESLFDAPFAQHAFRDGEYPEGDVLRPGTEPDGDDANDLEINLAAIDLRFDENVREAEELRLRAEAETDAQEPASIAREVPVEDVAEEPIRGVVAPASIDVDVTPTIADDIATTQAVFADVPIESARDSQPETAPSLASVGWPEPAPDMRFERGDDEGEQVPASSRQAAAESALGDVSLSPPTPAYATLHGDAPVASNWPILLGVVLGLLVGTAFGYFLGTRQRPEPVVATTFTAGGGEATGRADSAPRPESGAPAPGAPRDMARANGREPVAVAGAAGSPAAPTRGESSTNSAAVPRSPALQSAQPPSAARGSVVARPRAEAPRRADATATAAGADRPRQAADARLLVRSTPSGARVTVDGRDAGTTPATVTNLSAGTHNVRVSRDGYVTAVRRVRMRAASASQSIDVTLAAVRTAARPAPATPARPAAAAPPTADSARSTGQGALVIDSRPTGARVFIDGRQVGMTPLQIEGIEAGSHAVRLELEGFGPWATTVQVARGQRARVSGSLER